MSVKQTIMKHARQLSTRMLGLNYLHRGVVLFIDLFCSTLAGFFSYLCTAALEEWHLPANSLTAILGTTFATSALIFLIFRFYKVIIRHSSLRSLPRIIGALVLISLLLFAILRAAILPQTAPALAAAGFYFAFACALIIGVRICMISIYYLFLHLPGDRPAQRSSAKVFVYGKTADAVSIAEFLNTAYRGKYLPAAIIDPANDATDLHVGDMRVYGSHDTGKLHEDIIAKTPNAILFTSMSALWEESDRLVEWSNDAGVKLLVIPQLDKCTPDAPININPVSIEDLLERPEIRIEEDRIGAQINGLTVLVTGAAGSIGSELVRQLCRFTPKRIILLDCAETPLHLIRLEIEEKFPHIPITPIIADVRNKARCNDIVATWKPSIIFHAAAYKHVPLMEENPCEAVITNVQGTINMAQLAQEHGVSRFVMISTDKAVNPTNIMGATKRTAEMYVQALDAHLSQREKEKTGQVPPEGNEGQQQEEKEPQQPGATRYITTRFGNVLGSNGSVVPRFREQIAHGGPVTVTHPDIIRYFMTIPEACRLVLQAGTMGNGGEIFVFDMGKPVKIDRLARRMIQLSGYQPGKDIQIVYTGLRPGEKLYEEVLSSVESTSETSHGKIRLAKASNTTFESIAEQTRALLAAADARLEELTVLDLKDIVPEFKSQNSPFAALDKPHPATQAAS